MISIKGELAEYLKKRNERTPEQWESLDRIIWEKFATQSAVFVSDSCQFSYKTSTKGIIHTLALILRSHDLLVPVIEKHDGEFLKAEADNILATFPSVELALNSAIEMNNILADYNSTVPSSENYNICIGIGWGKVLRFENELFGDELNMAYQLGENVACKDEILLTASAYNEIKGLKQYELTFHKSLNFSGYKFDCYIL